VVCSTEKEIGDMWHAICSVLVGLFACCWLLLLTGVSSRRHPFTDLFNRRHLWESCVLLIAASNKSHIMWSCGLCGSGPPDSRISKQCTVAETAEGAGSSSARQPCLYGGWGCWRLRSEKINYVLEYLLYPVHTSTPVSVSSLKSLSPLSLDEREYSYC
jgi:hypothetical protein